MNGELFTFGASVRGPGHKRAGLPNQDAHLSFIKDGCGGIVLSDGLGSCIQSDKGSKAACCAVVSAMEHALTLMSFDVDVFLEEVKSIYCSSIDIDEYSDYLATCLWFFCPGDGRVDAGMLGDGMVALIDRINGKRYHCPKMSSFVWCSVLMVYRMTFLTSMDLSRNSSPSISTKMSQMMISRTCLRTGRFRSIRMTRR